MSEPLPKPAEPGNVPARPRGPSRQGLAEYVIVTLFLALAAAGGVAIFGDELRAALGVRAPAAAPGGAPPATETGR